GGRRTWLDRPRARDRRVAHRHRPRRRRRGADLLGDRGCRALEPRVSAVSNTDAAARARAVIPGGVNSPVRAFGSVGGTPLSIVSARGATVTDVAGREYVDLVASWGPALLGHAHPDVVEAVREAASRGLSFGASTPGETDL